MSITETQRSSADWESAIGDQFRALRIARDLDQAQLASRAGVSLGSVKNLEQGRGSTLKTIVRVARALDREDWLVALSPRITVSPIDVLRSSRREPRRRVYRPRGD